MGIIKCLKCETEFDEDYILDKRYCPYAYCYSRGEETEFKRIK